ncbi:MAG: PEP-CTERM sorting domain-containing protein, partial [Deltaproteobacteria bacterium]|nr:PEP-CTERM sorting domain-containing protein [Deltaproteobacteria bacterium]
VVFINDFVTGSEADKRGYIVPFTVFGGASYTPDKLRVTAQLSNAAGDMGGGTARVQYQIRGPGDVTLASGAAMIDFATGTSYQIISFNVSGVTLSSGSAYNVRANINELEGSLTRYATFDGLEMQAVPEPAANLLLGMALFGVSFIGRRRQH